MSIVVRRNGPVTTVVIDRPEARNAVDPATATALYRAFLDFEADRDARAAVVTGSEGAFCGGYDLKAAAAMAGEADPLGALAIPDDPASPTPRGPMGPTWLDLSKPVIAAVEGPAVAGGMELALWCDLRVVAEGGYFGVYCRRWGVPLIDGGTVRLPRIVGEGRALDLVLTGRKVEADEAFRIGLADRLVPRGEALAVAEALALDISRFPQLCLRADRASVRGGHGLSVAEALAREWRGAAGVLQAEGIAGAARFAGGKGRSGDFGDL